MPIPNPIYRGNEEPGVGDGFETVVVGILPGVNPLGSVNQGVVGVVVVVGLCGAGVTDGVGVDTVEGV